MLWTQVFQSAGSAGESAAAPARNSARPSSLPCCRPGCRRHCLIFWLSLESLLVLSPLLQLILCPSAEGTTGMSTYHGVPFHSASEMTSPKPSRRDFWTMTSEHMDQRIGCALRLDLEIGFPALPFIQGHGANQRELDFRDLAAHLSTGRDDSKRIFPGIETSNLGNQWATQSNTNQWRICRVVRCSRRRFLGLKGSMAGAIVDDARLEGADLSRSAPPERKRRPL
jgi:hypothetical protein